MKLSSNVHLDSHLFGMSRIGIVWKNMSSSAIGTLDSADHIEGRAPAPSAAVHGALAGCASVLLGFCVLAAPPGAMGFAKPLIIATLVLLPCLMLPAAYFHERKAWQKRDAALMLPWALLLAALVTEVAPTSATFAFPLRDMLWRSIDEHLWIRVPSIMAFTARHAWLQTVLTFSYYWTLHPLLLSAILLPALMGRVQAAQRFLLVNAMGFVLALPFMLMLPAVGPWVAWHFEPNWIQRSCEVSILSLRKGSFASGGLFGGIVCLPSFHAFWALVAAHALQSFRWLRFLAIALAVLITVSTVTTGWHYGVDVLAGILFAITTTYLASLVVPVASQSKTR